MLKPKHCYANEEVYNYNVFLHKARIHAFALNPYNMTQVKFVMKSKETIELGCDQKNFFVFANRDGKTRTMYREDAESILKFIDLIKDPRIEDYSDKISRLHYHSVGENKSAREFISVMIAGNAANIVDTSIVSVQANEAGDVKRKQVFDDVVKRLKLIMRQFIDLDDAGTYDALTISYSFGTGIFTYYPLVNKHAGWTANGGLRLQKVLVDGEWVNNHICFNYKSKDLLFYTRARQTSDSSSLSEVVEGFIAGLKILVDAYYHYYDDVNRFVKAVPVSLSEDRKDFMEYVSGRGVGADNHDGPYRTMLVNINSDAAPGSSKTMFHYHPEFVKDLYNGLRFLVSL